MKNLLVLALIGVLWPWTGFCQREQKLLKGDKVPEHTLRLDNFHQKEMLLSDFKGKVVLLAMWKMSDVSEKSSQRYWSTLNQLQQKYQRNLQIILMNPHDEEQKAKAYFKKRQHSEKISLPVMYKDDSLNNMFMTGGGFVLWIDQEGRFKEMSSISVVLEKNIKAAINYEPINKKINDPPKVAGLEVGDAMPDYSFTNLVNYPTKTAKLVDFKGKLVILDFWSTYCSSCIASWPKLLKLQEEFNDKIQIILVTWQDESIMKALFERRRRVAGVDMTLPAVYGDSVLTKKLFPHSGVPHMVWIDGEGVVQSITSSSEINAKNISKALREGDFQMPQKINNDEFVRFEQSKPIFVNGNGNWDREKMNVLWQSFFVKGIREIFPSLTLWTYRYHSMINVTHSSIKMLYAFAYNDRLDSGPSFLFDNRIALEVEDRVNYIGEKDGETDYSNRYIYQLLASRNVSKQQMLKRMQIDLKGNVGLDVRWEKRKKKCLVLSAADTSLFAYKEGPRSGYFSPFHASEFNKVTISDLVNQLQGEYSRSPYPIVDETGYSGLIGGITMDVDVKNHEALDKALQKYGLRFTIEEREVKVLVLSEPEGYVFPYDGEDFHQVFR